MNRKIVYTILSTILALQPALYYYISPSSGNVILTQAQSTPTTAKNVPAKVASKPKFTPKNKINQLPQSNASTTEAAPDAQKIIKATAPDTKTVQPQTNSQPNVMRAAVESKKPTINNGPVKQPNWLGTEGKTISIVFPDGAKANKAPSTPTQHARKAPAQSDSNEAEKKSKPATKPAAQQAVAPESVQEEPIKTEPENAPCADQNAQGDNLIPAKSFHIKNKKTPVAENNEVQQTPQALDATATPVQRAPRIMLPHPQRMRKPNSKTISTGKTETHRNITRKIKPQEIAHSAAPKEITSAAQHTRQEPAVQHVHAMQRHESQAIADSRTMNTVVTSAAHTHEPRAIADSRTLHTPLHEHGLQPTKLDIKIVDQILHANGLSGKTLPQKYSFTIPDAHGKPIFYTEITPETYIKAQQAGTLPALVHSDQAENVSKILAQECSATRQASLRSAQHTDAMIAHTPEAHVQTQAPRALEGATSTPVLKVLPQNNFIKALPAPTSYALPAPQSVLPAQIAQGVPGAQAHAQKVNMRHVASKIHTARSGNAVLNGALIATHAGSQIMSTRPTSNWACPRIAQLQENKTEKLSADRKLAVDVLNAGPVDTQKFMVKKSGTGLLSRGAKWFGNNEK